MRRAVPKCEHGRERRRCAPCGGSAMCPHGRERRRCTGCSGSALCLHARERSRCRVCVGGSVCRHSQQRVRCRECSPAQYMLNLMRTHTNSMLRRRSVAKTLHTVGYLGCSASEFCEHIHAKMRAWNRTHEAQMTLGTIHIDHIKPCASARSAGDVAALAHYTNMQPLLSADNLAKTNRWSPRDDLFWRQHISHNPTYKDVYWPQACSDSQHVHRQHVLK